MTRLTKFCNPLAGLACFGLATTTCTAATSADYALPWGIVDGGSGAAAAVSYSETAVSIGQGVTGYAVASDAYADTAGVIAATGDVDSDGDGLTDDEEAALGTNPHLTDSDYDDLSDFAEVGADATYDIGTDTDPLDPDTDDDGLKDGVDPDPLVPNPAVEVPLPAGVLPFLFLALTALARRVGPRRIRTIRGSRR